MINDNDFIEIVPKGTSVLATAEHVQNGLPIPKIVRVQTFSPDDWEGFIEEWASSLTSVYTKVRRFGGSGDMGIDVAGFCTDKGLFGDWDNYQCKRYGHPLQPADVFTEIGKIIYHSSQGEFIPPRKHYFAGSKGIGTSLEKLLNNEIELKRQCKLNWPKHCEKEITSTTELPLTNDLSAYFEAFNFSIFESKSVLELIHQHSKTSYHTVRFGGGLPPRPIPSAPPTELAKNESRYIRQLLDAYGDHSGEQIKDMGQLNPGDVYHKDFMRQRERFYHAEALRNFSRDTVPEGTFTALQEEIYQGVIDVCEAGYQTGFERMKATVSNAAKVISTSNPLAPATKVQDRQGICHQLANEDRLKWMLGDD